MSYSKLTGRLLSDPMTKLTGKGSCQTTNVHIDLDLKHGQAGLNWRQLCQAVLNWRQLCQPVLNWRQLCQTVLATLLKSGGNYVKLFLPPF